MNFYLTEKNNEPNRVENHRNPKWVDLFELPGKSINCTTGSETFCSNNNNNRTVELYFGKILWVHCACFFLLLLFFLFIHIAIENSGQFHLFKSQLFFFSSFSGLFLHASVICLYPCKYWNVFREIHFWNGASENGCLFSLFFVLIYQSFWKRCVANILEKFKTSRKKCSKGKSNFLM